MVGGVGGLLLLAAILFFLLRKRRKSHRDDFDDMMFDPTRAQNHAQVDLADPGAPTIEPYYAGGVASTAATSPEMTQYPRSAATTSEGNYGAQDRDESTANSAGVAGRGAGAYPHGIEQMPVPMPSGAAAGAGVGAMAGGAMGAKQREAYQEQQRFRVTNQGGPSGSGGEPMSPTGTTRSGPVTVHDDAGSVKEEDEPNLGAEIPPTYDSIRK